MSSKDKELLPYWVESYYKGIVKNSNLNGVKFAYYKSLRGYFKHSILLTDIQEKEFTLVDYRVWSRILTKVKSGHNPVESGGLYFRYADYSDLCKKRSWFRTKSNFIRMKLLVETPFKDYYILNPLYIIKLYNPKVSKSKDK